jgi:hypothetical protein
LFSVLAAELIFLLLLNETLYKPGYVKVNEPFELLYVIPTGSVIPVIVLLFHAIAPPDANVFPNQDPYAGKCANIPPAPGILTVPVVDPVVINAFSLSVNSDFVAVKSDFVA